MKDPRIAAMVGGDVRQEGLVGRMFGMTMTAAGTLAPARVLVLGAGVAGLQAIATAKRLGGVVSANDVRAASADEVRSVGGTFIDLDLGTADATGGYAKELADLPPERQVLISTGSQGEPLSALSRIAQRSHIGNVRIGGMHPDSRDRHGLCEPDVRPRAAAVQRLVDAVPLEDVAAQLGLAHADVDHIRVGL